MSRKIARFLNPWTLLKIALSLGIVGFLLYRAQAQNPETFADLVRQPKHWGYLGLATAACFSATFLTFLRWHYLIHALEIPCRLGQTVRISFLGYLFNLAPMGIVGGDLLKAVMLAREQHSRRAEAVATVFVDRLIGLYVLFLVASGAILTIGLQKTPEADLRTACNTVLLVTAVFSLALAALFIPGVTNGRMTQFLAGLPKVGGILESLINAVRMYRRKVHVLVNSCLISVAVHSLFTMGVFWIACGLFQQVLPLITHFVILPVSASMGVIPLPLGPMEAVLEYLYTRVPAPEGVVIVAGQGLIIALAYRIITVLFAAVGLGYYLTSRREVAEVMDEVEHEAEAGVEVPDEAAADGAEAARSTTRAAAVAH